MAFDNVLTRGAKNVAFSDVTKGLIKATVEMPFGLPEYFALILRMVGTLEGIAVQADENWIFVDAAFPFVSKKLLMEESSKDILQEMIVADDGKLSLSRISLLLESFDSFSEKNVRSVGPESENRNIEMEDQMLAEKIRDSLLFFFSDEGKNLREFTE